VKRTNYQLSVINYQLKIMVANVQEIKKWESVEVERSASEAKKKDADDLRIRREIVERYSNPPSGTFYSLEYLYHLLGDVAGKTVLDYGCGAGENSVLIASRGARVLGVDISPELVGLAEKRLAAHDLAQNAEFRVGSAHELPVEDESIDVVFGNAILHHLDLKLSSKEVFRVLKKGGRAIFLEPVRNSKFVWFIRNLIPYQQPDLSPFERPLTDAELKEFALEFSEYKSRAFSLPFVNLVEVLGLPENLYHSAVKIDGHVLKKAKFLNYYASVRVIEIIK
jgi:ubiquinone/menaquinone biosynthesis C-methylase UbiE